MKVLVSGHRKQRVVIFSFLVTFLFSGIGVVSGLPIFFTALAHAHPVFFSGDNHRIRLILHHPGNQDAHEVTPIENHRHDLLDAVIGISKKSGLPLSDHEVEISAAEDTFSTNSKAQLILDDQTFFAAVPKVLSVFARGKDARFSGLSPPTENASSLSLRSTILLI